MKKWASKKEAVIDQTVYANKTKPRKIKIPVIERIKANREKILPIMAKLNISQVEFADKLSITYQRLHRIVTYGAILKKEELANLDKLQNSLKSSSQDQAD